LPVCRGFVVLRFGREGGVPLSCHPRTGSSRLPDAERPAEAGRVNIFTE
jgi:hypothetical protein